MGGVGWGQIKIKDHLSPAKAEIRAELGKNVVGKWFMYCSLVWDSQIYQRFFDRKSFTGPPKKFHL